MKQDSTGGESEQNYKCELIHACAYYFTRIPLTFELTKNVTRLAWDWMSRAGSVSGLEMPFY